VDGVDIVDGTVVGGTVVGGVVVACSDVVGAVGVVAGPAASSLPHALSATNDEITAAATHTSIRRDPMES